MNTVDPTESLVWIDLEMTGLDPMTDTIIEMATIVTDKHLNILVEGPVIAIHHPQATLDTMDEWNQRTHGESGLIARVLASQVSMRQAELQTLEFLQSWTVPGKSPMCGNSICQDRRFMVRLMPQLEQFFHYRNLDVSTVKELARRWHPDILQGVKKNASHQALDDIRGSIGELVYYRTHFFRS
ncbi:MAG TPA: oligoribonuclease [Halothiobacillus sp.]|nr:oligoribonuclease [Halothiobacillus sp.]